MSDIVERLRIAGANRVVVGHTKRALCKEAADEIERLRAALTQPASVESLTDEQKDAMWRVAYRENSTRFGSFDWYAQGVEDAERAHGIVDKE